MALKVPILPPKNRLAVETHAILRLNFSPESAAATLTIQFTLLAMLTKMVACTDSTLQKLYNWDQTWKAESVHQLINGRFAFAISLHSLYSV